MPSRPDRSTSDIHADDDGTFSVVWTSTERVVAWNGAPQHGFTLDQVDDAADRSEAQKRMAATRGSGVDG